MANQEALNRAAFRQELATMEQMVRIRYSIPGNHLTGFDAIIRSKILSIAATTVRVSDARALSDLEDFLRFEKMLKDHHYFEEFQTAIDEVLAAKITCFAAASMSTGVVGDTPKKDLRDSIKETNAGLAECSKVHPIQFHPMALSD